MAKLLKVFFLVLALSLPKGALHASGSQVPAMSAGKTLLFLAVTAVAYLTAPALACDDFDPCVWGKVCNNQNNCVIPPKYAVGHYCKTDHYCKSGYCKTHKCAKKKSCATDSGCTVNHFCKGGKCELQYEPGHACSRDEQCITGDCDANSKC